MYSMGSSMVMMWPSRRWLIRSIMQASVVDLPLPAGPVTSTSPFIRSAAASTVSGIDSASGSGKPKRITRSTTASEPRWCSTLARKRPISRMAKEKSSSASAAATRAALRPQRA